MNETEPIRIFVREVLALLPTPYSEHITDEICLHIEKVPELDLRYDGLTNEFGTAVVNNWIGQYTAELTGRKSGKSLRARSILLETYKTLWPGSPPV